MLAVGDCVLNLSFEARQRALPLKGESQPVPGHRRERGFWEGSGSLGGQLLCVLHPHRVFGNSWDSDEDAPARPQPLGHVPVVANSDGYCSHNEDGTNGETEAQRGTATHQGRPAVAAVSGGGGEPGSRAWSSAGEKDLTFVSPNPARLGQPRGARCGPQRTGLLPG